MCDVVVFEYDLRTPRVARSRYMYMTSTVLPWSPRFYTVHRRGPASPVLQTAAASTPSWKNLNVWDWGTATPTHRQLPTCSQQRMTLCLNVC